ncbi:MAG: universal stress protein, partial [Halobacteria archaeon]|nr:universal stress protein [Halobacteria archaeon]
HGVVMTLVVVPVRYPLSEHSRATLAEAIEIATENDADLRFLYAHDVDEGESVHDYHESIKEVCTASVEYEVHRTSDPVDTLIPKAEDADLAVVATSAQNRVLDIVFGSFSDEIAERFDSTLLLAHTYKPRRQSFIRRLFENHVF